MKVASLFLLVSAIVSAQTQSLTGKVPTEFSNGFETRAKTLQQLIANVETFYEKQYPEYRFTVKLKVLDSIDWKKLSYQMPYGLPHLRDALVIGADKKAMFPDQTAADKISVFDGIAIHELGHYFMRDLAQTDIWPNWANEFIATYFQLGYAVPNQLPTTIPDNGFVPKFRSLEDFEKGFGYIGGDNYGWYQGQFMKLAEALYTKHGLLVLNQFIENYKPGGKRLDAMLLLKRIDSPVMEKWLSEMKSQ